MTEDDSRKLKDLEKQFFQAKSKEDLDKILAQIIKTVPNDYDLGAYMRYLFAGKTVKL